MKKREKSLVIKHLHVGNKYRIIKYIFVHLSTKNIRSMLYFPNAKINIGLNITSKREDGFHNLTTLFYPLQLCDGLEIVENNKDQTTLTTSGIVIDGDPLNNLVYKAYELIKKKYTIPSLDLHLHKKIPFGAGLGGGSADASFVLKGLNELFDLKIEEDELLSMAAKLGSDCPFFIINTPAYATGRGEILTPTPLDLSGYRLVLVNPNILVPTPEAFKYIKPKQPDTPLLEALKLPVEKWDGVVVNDFEVSVFKQYPVIARLKEDLYKLGASYVSMSGSGSSVFALFKEEVNWNKEKIDPSYFIWEEIIK